MKKIGSLLMVAAMIFTLFAFHGFAEPKAGQSDEAYVEHVYVYSTIYSILVNLTIEEYFEIMLNNVVFYDMFQDYEAFGVVTPELKSEAERLESSLLELTVKPENVDSLELINLLSMYSMFSPDGSGFITGQFLELEEALNEFYTLYMQGNVNEEKFTQAFNRLVVALAVLDLTEDGVKQTLKNVKEYIELGEFPDIIYTDYSNSRALRIISELGELDKNKEKLTLNEIMSYVYYYTNCISVLNLSEIGHIQEDLWSHIEELEEIRPYYEENSFAAYEACLLYTSICV